MIKIGYKKTKKNHRWDNIAGKKVFFLLLFAIFLTITVTILAELYVDYSLKSISLIATVFVIITMYILSKLTDKKYITFSFVYLLVFSIFHLGLAIPFSFGYEPGRLFFWIESQEAKFATYLVLIGVLGYFIGSLIPYLNKRKHLKKTPASNKRFERIMAKLAFLLLISGLGIWVLVVLSSGGVGLMFSSYRVYLDATAGNVLITLALLFISLGFPLLLAGEDRWLKVIGILLFSFWAVVAFFLGLRGEVLFPLVTYIIISARKGREYNFSVIVIGALLLLSLVSFVKQSRQLGISSVDLAEIVATPIDAVAEMGASLRPIVEVIKWREMGDEYIFGASYWAPFERLLLRLFPYKERINARDDQRLMNVLASDRVGGMGFSPIAEAYRNFSVIGVLLYMMFLGYILSKLDLLPASTLTNSLTAVIFIPFLIQVRNAFTPVPVQLIFGVLLVYIVFKLSKVSFKA